MRKLFLYSPDHFLTVKSQLELMISWLKGCQDTSLTQPCSQSEVIIWSRDLVWTNHSSPCARRAS